MPRLAVVVAVAAAVALLASDVAHSGQGHSEIYSVKPNGSDPVDLSRNAADDSFPVRIIVHTDDRPGMLNQLTSVLYAENTNIRSLEAKTELDHDGGVVEMTVDVRDKKQLEKLVGAMRRISGVRDVERLFK